MIRVGERLGHFLIRAEIGRGGMGTIYFATDTTLGRDVALKVVHPQLADNPQLMERFKIEAMTQARLSHPNIVTIFSFHRIEDEYVIAMEYVAGRSLKEMLQERKHLQPEEAVDLIVQVAEGLRYAPARNVIHRDIKPANILVDREGRVKISDFGIAKILGAQGLTKTGMLIGTPWYTSPEQIIGREIDFRSDLYSLGVTFYEVLTGRVPFDSETNSEFQIQKAHLETPPPRPSIYNPEIGIKLENFILKALQKKAEKRFQSARDMIDDLNRIRLDLVRSGRTFVPGATQRLDGAAGGMRRWPARALRALALLAVLLAAVGAFLFFTGKKGMDEIPQPPPREGAAASAAREPAAATAEGDSAPAPEADAVAAPPADDLSRDGSPGSDAQAPGGPSSGDPAAAGGGSAEAPATRAAAAETDAPALRPREEPGLPGKKLGSLDDELGRLRTLLAQRDLAVADRLASALLRSDPDSRALPLLGKVKFLAGHFAAVETIWARALRENLLVSVEVAHVHAGGGVCLGQLRFKRKLLLFNSDSQGDHSFALTGEGIFPLSLAPEGAIRVRGVAGGQEIQESFLVAGRLRQAQRQKFLIDFLNRHVL